MTPPPVRSSDNSCPSWLAQSVLQRWPDLGNARRWFGNNGRRRHYGGGVSNSSNRAGPSLLDGWCWSGLGTQSRRRITDARRHPNEKDHKDYRFGYTRARRRHRLWRWNGLDEVVEDSALCRRWRFRDATLPVERTWRGFTGNWRRRNMVDGLSCGDDFPDRAGRYPSALQWYFRSIAGYADFEAVRSNQMVWL